MPQNSYAIRQMPCDEIGIAVGWAALEAWNPGLTPKLNLIRIPVLLTCGEYNESTIHKTVLYHSGLWGSEKHVFNGTSHFHQTEKPDENMQVVSSVLERSEAKQ